MRKMDKAFGHAKQALALIPENISAMALMRHAERKEFAVGHHGNDILLTDQGKEDAHAMGELMKSRISRLFHSPVPRCLQTAEQLADGSGGHVCPEELMALRCDAYVDNFDAALTTLQRLVSEDNFYDVFVNTMATSGKNIPYPYFKPPLVGAGDLTRPMLSCSGICVGVTHDWLVNVAASYATGNIVGRTEYAGFLDTLFVWRENGGLRFYYKGRQGVCGDDFVRAVAVESGL